METRRERLSALLPLNASELEFLRRLNDWGEIAPELITGDLTMQAIVREHPGLRWKALNVRQHRVLIELIQAHGPGAVAGHHGLRKARGGPDR